MNTSIEKNDSKKNKASEKLKKFLVKATESTRRKAYRKNLPVAVSENGVIYLIYPDGTKKIAEEI